MNDKNKTLKKKTSEDDYKEDDPGKRHMNVYDALDKYVGVKSTIHLSILSKI